MVRGGGGPRRAGEARGESRIRGSIPLAAVVEDPDVSFVAGVELERKLGRMRTVKSWAAQPDHADRREPMIGSSPDSPCLTNFKPNLYLSTMQVKFPGDAEPATLSLRDHEVPEASGATVWARKIWNLRFENVSSSPTDQEGSLTEHSAPGKVLLLVQHVIFIDHCRAYKLWSAQKVRMVR